MQTKKKSVFADTNISQQTEALCVGFLFANIHYQKQGLNESVKMVSHPPLWPFPSGKPAENQFHTQRVLQSKYQ